MNINELKPADILLFSGEKGDFISDAIIWLTDSPVMHAALSYIESDQSRDQIVEAIPDGVSKSRLDMNSPRFKGRRIYVKRLKKQPESMTPVINIATEYLGTPYATSNFYLIAMILLYKKFTPDTLGKLKWIIIKIFEKLTANIIDFINEMPSKTPMVCSQFVYQCYQEAGEDYHLQIKNGCLINDSVTESEEKLSLIDSMRKHPKIMTSQQLLAMRENQANLTLKNKPEQSEQELAQELLETLQAKDKNLLLATAEIPEDLDEELILAAHELGAKIYQANTIQRSQHSELLQSSVPRNIDKFLSYLKEQQAYFVTPGDLFNHCENLIQIGCIK